MSHRGGRKRGKQKPLVGGKSKPSWQPTLNHYFGGNVRPSSQSGESVPVQPTLKYFFKKHSQGAQEIDRRGGEVEERASSRNEARRESSLGMGVAAADRKSSYNTVGENSGGRDPRNLQENKDQLKPELLVQEKEPLSPVPAASRAPVRKALTAIADARNSAQCRTSAGRRTAGSNEWSIDIKAPSRENAVKDSETSVPARVPAEHSTSVASPCSYSHGSRPRTEQESLAVSSNPFSISNHLLASDLRPRPPQLKPDACSKVTAGSPMGGENRRKSLSLKTRKRKLSTSPSKTGAIKPSKLQQQLSRTKEDRSPHDSHLSPPSKQRNAPQALSYEDQAMLLQYSSEAPVNRHLTLADLEDLERDKAAKVISHSHAEGSLAVTHSPISLLESTAHFPASHTHLPTSPTFSPHPHPLTPSPYPSSLRAPPPSTSADTSLLLFSPSPTASSERERRVSKQAPPSAGLLPTAATTSDGSCETEGSTGCGNCLRPLVERQSGVKDDGLERLGMEVPSSREGVTSGSGVHTEMRARRVLFQASDEGSGGRSPSDHTPDLHSPTQLPANTVQQPSASCDNHIYDFPDENFSISEFMSESLLAEESHDLMCDATCASCDQITCKSHDFSRYLVLECVTQERMDEDALLSTGRHKPEMKLRLFDALSSSERLCYLRDDWLQTEVKAGDTVQVNGALTPDGCYVISNEDGCSLVVNPDTLISGTTVATSISCARRAVLSELMKGSSSGTEAMVIGRMLHEVFQGALRRKGEGPPITMATVMEEIHKVVGTMESLEQLYALGMSETAAVEILSGHAPNIVEWCRRFLHPTPLHGRGEIEFKRSPSDPDGSACVAVSDVLDIEENIWCPRFGLKGKVDVTVNVQGQWAVGGPVENFRAPLELKTGKMFRKQGSIEHRAQVTLYTMMLADRYGNNVPGGLLCYLKAGHTQGLPALPHEKRGLLIARNLVAGYLGNQHGHMTLPAMLREKHTCKYCPYLKQCALYHKAVERGTEDSSGLGQLFPEATAHLPPNQLQFFAKWSQLVLEEYTHSRGREGGRGMWLSGAHEREREGRCLADMQAGPATEDQSNGRYLQRFRKTPGSETSGDLALSVNDRVVISCQDRSKWAVVMGTITMVTPPRELLVLVDKPVVQDDTLYRLDEVRSHSPATLLSNLAKLCISDSERDHCLRELVIDLRPPRFKSECRHTEEQLHEGLNASQTAAIHRVLSAQDYALVLGMPGSGKSTTIAHLVRVLVARGNSVLITSYTHSAVDNILLKLKEAGIDFLRLGTPSRVHPSLHPHTPSFIGRGIAAVHDLEELYHGKPVVATTCLGISHPLFSHRSFDYCIVDEASQITLPVSLGPLRHSGIFVLVGDHYQLPPLVQSERAREGGLDVSLFRWLSEHHPTALACLEEQYRMNSEIMSLSNHLVYNQRLRCGSVGVATARLRAPMLERRDVVGWLWRAVDPTHPVVFLNTDGAPLPSLIGTLCDKSLGVEPVNKATRKCDAMETHSGENVFNSAEAQLVSKTIDILIEGGVPSGDIGVITPYRQQQKIIRERLKEKPPERQNTDSEGVEVNTVDKYQGRDKACVLVSLVRSNPRGNVGSLLQDWRRVNVALSRAKHKLVLIGSRKTLRHAPLMASLLQLLAERNWIVDVM